MAHELFERVLDGATETFALLHRPEAAGSDVIEVLAGTPGEEARLADLPLPEGDTVRAGRHEMLVLVPYRQLTERGFTVNDDGAPLLTMAVTDQQTVRLAEALWRLPDLPIELTDGGFDTADADYADIVRKVIADEIGTGEGANFVIKRSYVAEVTAWGRGTALSFFRRLLEKEKGAYWTYLVHTGGRTFVGATPERHLSLTGGRAVMNPISGTYRYPPSGPTVPEVLDFLADRKEADELYMVVDEELKMMARICDAGGRVVGPHLKEMAKLAHTEYFIEGTTSRDVRDILHETMFAPTVTGSPLESACRVISRHEPQGRGYYSGVVALIGRDDEGARAMDSSILIRTAEIDAAGRMAIAVGATLVRHSDPDSEVAETRAKAAGLLSALGADGTSRLGDEPAVHAALVSRNEHISEFWLRDCAGRSSAEPALAGRKVLVVDAEDTFTSMIDHQLRSLGLEVTVRRFDEPYGFEGYDLVVMGPGPGDPRDVRHPKVAHLRAAIGTLLAERRPFLAVCLSHQVLSGLLGLDLVRRPVPNQGVQRPVELFGSPERVGFYNAFAAHSEEDKTEVDGVGVVEISRDPHTGEVHGLRGPGFASMQFHAESVLTVDGVRITRGLLTEALGTAALA